MTAIVVANKAKAEERGELRGGWSMRENHFCFFIQYVSYLLIIGNSTRRQTYFFFKKKKKKKRIINRNTTMNAYSTLPFPCTVNNKPEA